MINVNNISISNDGSKLSININTGNTYIITSIKLWTEDTYKDYNIAKDLSYKLEQVNNKEIFIVEADELGYSSFNGIYFIEITSNQPTEDECVTCSDPILVVVTNLNQYYRCMSELVLKASICTDNLFSREVCDDSAVNKALTINLFIDSVNQCLELGQFIEAIDLMKSIKKLCNKCTNCKTIIKNTNSCTTCNQYIYN